MQIHLDMLPTDWFVWALFFGMLIYIGVVCRRRHLREAWRYVLTQPLGMMAIIILACYSVIGLVDSIHVNVTTPQSESRDSTAITKSVLDILIAPLGQQQEKTYSAPFSTTLYNPELITQQNGHTVRDYARLNYAGRHLQDPATEKIHDILLRCAIGCGIGLIIFFILSSLLYWIYGHNFLCGKTTIAWRSFVVTFSVICTVFCITALTATHYHIFGTDQVGRDIFYESLSSIRTGLLLGTLATLFMLPFALMFGMLAGYFQGWVDDAIQYLYTTLSSIPGVLLISAAILVIQVYIAKHESAFPTLRDRADARLLALCIILGITSWASLCRLLRAETLKLRELGFIQAAKALGVKPLKIIWRHIMPNVMHIVLITIVLDFSSLVLAEAVLSYVGVGVDPTTASFGNMINASRLELAREPLVWWPLLAALVFMFVLILAANIFSDTVRDAFDPAISTQ